MVKSTPTDLSDKKESVEYFDYVMIWTGRFSVPNIPKFKGYDTYDGKIVHMHELRKLEPELFDDKNVLIVGAGNSAMDLIFFCFFNQDTNKLVKPNKVFVTSRKISKFETSEDFKPLLDEGKLIIKKGNINEMKSEKQIEFGDGSQETIDTVIYWTGYQIWLPFIDPDDGLIEFDHHNDRWMYVGPLYKKLFAVKNPRIMLPGLVWRQFLGNAVFEKQVMLCAQFIKGELKLPTEEEMINEIEEEIEFLKESGENFYCFGYTNWAFRYMEEMAKISTLKEDKRYYNFKTCQNLWYDLKSLGKEMEYRGTDFKTLFEGIIFEPTSDLF